jgi:ankyrin repeat protein
MLLACGADIAYKGPNDKLAIDLVQAKDENTKKALQNFQNLLTNIKKGETRLHLAIKYENSPAIWLLTQLENIDQQDDEGISPLHLAVQMGQLDYVLRLLQAGATVNIQDKLGQHPLGYAPKNSSGNAIAKLLIQAGQIQ